VAKQGQRYRYLCAYPGRSGALCRGQLGEAARQVSRAHELARWQSGDPEPDHVKLPHGPVAVVQAVLKTQREGRDPLPRTTYRRTPVKPDWVLTHPRRYRKDDKGRYVVLRGPRSQPGWQVDIGNRRVGRRPAPHSRLSDREQKIVGEFPILPAVVVCPICTGENLVEAPPVV
jgi:hypothetical protein